MNKHTVDQYLAWPALALPHKHSIQRFELHSVKGKCKCCEQYCEHLRGIVTEWPTCIQIRYGGLCRRCKLVTYFEFRWYGDHLLHRCDAGWVLYPFNIIPWRRIMKILAWAIVIAGWTLYGLVVLASILHPHKSDPIEDFQQFFSAQTWVHWRINLVMLGLAAVYLAAFAYTRKDK